MMMMPSSWSMLMFQPQQKQVKRRLKHHTPGRRKIGQVGAIRHGITTFFVFVLREHNNTPEISCYTITHHLVSLYLGWRAGG